MEGKEIPCHETEFARDSVFFYSTSCLPDYVEEKTKGSILAKDVERLLLDDVGGDCCERLCTLSNDACVVVDVEQQSDLDSFCRQLKQVATQFGRRFLFRSGASLLTSLAQLPLQPIPAAEMEEYAPMHHPGSVLVGSHVQKSTQQLNDCF